MTLMYRWNNMEYSLEYLIKGYSYLFREKWRKALLDEYKFNVKRGNPILLSELISEATESFEDLCQEDNLMIEFVKNDDSKMDFNILLEPIL